MNKKNYFIILLFVVFMLVGCNKLDNPTSKTETTEKEIISTIVSGDAIINIDKNGNVIDYDGNTVETEGTKNETTDIVLPTEAPEFEEGVMEEIDKKDDLNYTVYLPDKDYLHLISNVYVAEDISDIPQCIINKLKVNQVIDKNIKINNIFFGKDRCIIDLSGEFLTQIKKMGTSGEYYMMAGIVNSFIETYPNINYVKVIVDGDGFETGHCEYYDYLSKYEE